MRVPDHPTQIRRMLDSRRKQRVTRSPVLAASLSTCTHRCGRPSCRCRHGGPLHTGQQVTCPEQGQTRSVYVSKDLLPEVRAWIAEHNRLERLLHDIHLLSLALIRTHARHRRLEAGRP